MLGTGCRTYREGPRSPVAAWWRCLHAQVDIQQLLRDAPAPSSGHPCTHMVTVAAATAPSYRSSARQVSSTEERVQILIFLSVVQGAVRFCGDVEGSARANAAPNAHRSQPERWIWGRGCEGLEVGKRGRKEEREGTASMWGPGRALTLAPWPGLSGQCPSGSTSRAMLPAAPGYARGRQLETTGYCLREEIYYRAPCKAQIRLSRRREKTLGVCYMYAELVMLSNAVQ